MSAEFYTQVFYLMSDLTLITSPDFGGHSYFYSIIRSIVTLVQKQTNWHKNVVN